LDEAAMTNIAAKWIKRLDDHARNVGGDESFERLYGTEACGIADAITTLLERERRKDEALKRIADRAGELRKGTDDWFELAEIENVARTALTDTEDKKDKLTPAFLAMTPLQKWETLVLSGLIGTDEPWIENMRTALREQADAITTILERERRLTEALQTLVTARDHWLKTRWDSDEEAVAGMALDDAHKKARATLTKKGPTNG
jgi:hypothetical protein